MNKQIRLYSNNELLLSNRKELTTDICNNIWSQKHYTEQKKLENAQVWFHLDQAQE